MRAVVDTKFHKTGTRHRNAPQVLKLVNFVLNLAVVSDDLVTVMYSTSKGKLLQDWKSARAEAGR